MVSTDLIVFNCEFHLVSFLFCGHASMYLKYFKYVQVLEYKYNYNGETRNVKCVVKSRKT